MKEDKKTKEKMSTKDIIAVIVAILIIVGCIGGCIGAKMNKNAIIISNLQEQNEFYKIFDNYSVSIRKMNNKDATYNETTTALKDGVYKISEVKLNKDINVGTKVEFVSENKDNIYESINEKKTVSLSSNTREVITPFISYTKVNSSFDAFMNKLNLEYKICKIDNEDCYEIKNLKGAQNLFEDYDGDVYAYIDIDTGLLLKLSSESLIDNDNMPDKLIKIQYDLNGVKDEDMQEPDINEYEIVNNK